MHILISPKAFKYFLSTKATLQLLQKLGLEVVYPSKQTCCGQPIANSGFEHLFLGYSDLFIENFSAFEYIIAPSASCVLHLKDHLTSQTNPELAISIQLTLEERILTRLDLACVK